MAGSDASQDEVFLGALQAGQALLNEGKVAEAKVYLERAHAAQPKSERGRNLLGVTYFKLGMHEQAADLYESLTLDNPADASLRLNLGLVYLKMGALDRAVHELEIATDLDPEHARAHNYLAVALSQQGNYAGAREHFLLAGSTAQAERMAAKAVAVGAAAADKPLPGVDPAEITPPIRGVAGVNGGRARVKNGGSWSKGATDGADVKEADADAVSGMLEAIEEEVSLTDDDVVQIGAGAAVAPPSPTAVPAAAADGSITGLTAWAKAQSASLLPSVAPFQADGHSAWVTVKGRSLVRSVGLKLASGALRWVPAVKRFHGSLTEYAFGAGADRMFRVEGEGSLLFAQSVLHFVALDLEEEQAFFYEPILFALDGVAPFENGRLESSLGTDLDLVQVQGPGAVLLRCAGGVSAIEVEVGVPTRVPLESFAGWTGVLTPRLVPLWEGEGGPLCVELTGQGFALWLTPEALARG